MKVTQGLCFVIASIAVSKNAKGEEIASYWGEAVGKNKQRMPFRIGANQVKHLIEAKGLNSVQDLIGLTISGNMKGYQKDDLGNDRAGLLIVDRYTDKETGEVKKYNNPRFIIGGLLQPVSNFNEMIHEWLDFSTLTVEEDRREETTVSTPKPAVAPVAVDADEETAG